MKFTVSSSDLFNRLQTLSRVINPKMIGSIPILNNILFTVKGNQLTLLASDSDTTVSSVLDLVSADQDLSMAIPAKNILDIFKEISEQPVVFEVNPDNHEVCLSYQNGVLNFMANSADEFPTMPLIDEVEGDISFTSADFQKAISSTLFASDDNSNRPVMNGVLLDITNQSATFVASDSHKLVRLRYDSYGDARLPEGEKRPLIMRKKPLALLKSVLPKDESLVHIRFNNKRMIIDAGDYTISTLLIEGRFPNYNAVIPKENPYVVWIDRLSLLNALKRVSLCTDQANSLVRLELSDNQLKLSGQDLDYSSSAEEVVSCQYTGEPILIGFSSQYLMEVLSNLPSDDIIIQLADASRPGLVLPSQNEEGEDLLMLLMPMTIRG